ncbi:DUF861 domain-containing protein [Arachnia propionica]|uniref:DUF861 domain-containing protein n=1 Tax=Arachnia propionica TaxID=1750 RepID=A0A3P1T659_9ACTN|nr:cupin domain-containing protein [Arachnia propionica]RRD04987.1 DUF861 domain-containing protein [Arachnia propionica]
MGGRLVITADRVRDAVGGSLEVPAGAVVTPLARDVAADLGVTLVEGTGTQAAAPAKGQGALADQVRDIVTKLLAGTGLGTGVNAPAPAHPVKLCRGDQVVTEPFPYPGPQPGQQVRTADVVTGEDGSPMAAGYMSLTKGSFPWHFSYDEVQIVLEGELHLGTPDGVRVGRPGDVLYVPKGSDITFGTPSWARFVYVTFPADWEAGL